MSENRLELEPNISMTANTVHKPTCCFLDQFLDIFGSGLVDGTRYGKAYVEDFFLPQG